MTQIQRDTNTQRQKDRETHEQEYTKIENEILKDIIKVCEEVRKDEARTQKFFSVKDKTRYKSWTAQDYT